MLIHPFHRDLFFKAWLSPAVVLLLCGVLGGLSGCGPDADRPGFAVLNDSGKQLGHLVITEAGPVLNYNRLEHGEEISRDLPRAKELPRSVKVNWQDHEGKHHEQRIELWKHLPSSYNGTVRLTLDKHGTLRVSKAA